MLLRSGRVACRGTTRGFHICRWCHLQGNSCAADPPVAVWIVSARCASADLWQLTLGATRLARNQAARRWYTAEPRLLRVRPLQLCSMSLPQSPPRGVACYPAAAEQLSRKKIHSTHTRCGNQTNASPTHWIKSTLPACRYVLPSSYLLRHSQDLRAEAITSSSRNHKDQIVRKTEEN